MNHVTLPRVNPEFQGVSSSAIIDFVKSADEFMHHLHSFMLLRRGSVVAEGWWQPYDPETRHMLFSVSKSFTAAAVGLTVEEGRLSLESPLITFFPEELPKDISPNLAEMKVRHLLSMTTGHEADTLEPVMRADDPIKAFLELPVSREPGKFFVYNSGASFMLAAILQKVTGQELIEYLTPRLFEPLGIQGATWDSHPNGTAFGGWGLNLKTEDIARFGQLYLQKGEWRGRQILPSAWVDESALKHIAHIFDDEPDWIQGYGFQFWRCQAPGVYRGDGAFGQFCIIMPQEEAVLAITAGVMEMQAVLNLVWEKLLPGMNRGLLPENTPATQELDMLLKGLSIETAAGDKVSPLAADLAGKTFTFAPDSAHLLLRVFDFEPVPAALHNLAIDFRHNRMTYSLIGKGGLCRSDTLNFGIGTWVKNTALIGLPAPSKVAASGTWTTEDTFTLDLCLYETPFTNTLAFSFAQDQVTLNFQTNVSFGQTELPPVVGKLSRS